MPEPLKNLYNDNFFDECTEALAQVLPGFDKADFLSQIHDPDWERRELKQRMRHITLVLKNFLPEPYPEATGIISRLISVLRKKYPSGMNFPYMFLADYVELFGLDDPETSIRAMEEITTFTSAEFAVRPFIRKYPERMMKQMLLWSGHSDYRVRRLASEGCRPRLPWAMALPEFKADPSPVLPVLENLRKDPEDFVRRSVANNLNDIAKDNPDIVVEIAGRWSREQHPSTDWILRHGCRTLLKRAHPEILQHYGFIAADVLLENFSLSQEKISIGDDLNFSFSLKVASGAPAKLRLEYAVYYLKASGRHSRKVFQITENIFEAGKSYSFSKKQRFTDFSTRKHYPGEHTLALLVNGEELAGKSFVLSEQE